MPLPEKKKKINNTPMRDKVYETLLTWIMEGILRPGEKILDKELAEHLGVSRTPVREALRRLEDKNLVTSSANRWTRVSEISEREPEMVYPIIWTLEQLAASTAMDKLTENDFLAMESANSEFRKSIEDDDPVLASKADAGFHNVYIERSGNDHIIEILQDMKIRFRRFEVIFFDKNTYAMESADEHDQIITALRNHDVSLSKQMIRLNWEKSLSLVNPRERRQNNGC